MDISVLYNVFPQETFGTLIAIYFYLTGLSAGSFVLSTLAYVFGMERFKPIGKIGVILAALFLVMAPLALLVHVGQPFKAWHLFVHLNATSPITWGSFPPDPLPDQLRDLRLVHVQREQEDDPALRDHRYPPGRLRPRLHRVYPGSGQSPGPMEYGLDALPLPGLGHGLGHRLDDPHLHRQRPILLQGEEPSTGNSSSAWGNLLAAMILIDLFLVLSDVLVLLVSHAEAQEVAHLILTGKFSFYFIGVENFMGKIIPAIYSC